MNELNAQDLRVEHYFAPGQLANEQPRAAHVTHIPSGNAVTSETERTSLQNTAAALRVLTEILASREANPATTRYHDCPPGCPEYLAIAQAIHDKRRELTELQRQYVEHIQNRHQESV